MEDNRAEESYENEISEKRAKSYYKKQKTTRRKQVSPTHKRKKKKAKILHTINEPISKEWSDMYSLEKEYKETISLLKKVLIPKTITAHKKGDRFTSVEVAFPKPNENILKTTQVLLDHDIPVPYVIEWSEEPDMEKILEQYKQWAIEVPMKKTEERIEDWDAVKVLCEVNHLDIQYDQRPPYTKKPRGYKVK